MDVKETDNITVAIYKDYKRFRVFNISQKLLTWIIIVNSLVIIGCIIFFFGFIFQWTYNWKIVEENKVLQKEISSLKR
ncbi:MAG: hypothetical protein WCQ47_02210 [bacterium]